MPIRKAPTPEEARNLFLRFPNKKLKDWADEWGCTPERVRQIKIESGVKSKFKVDISLAKKIASYISEGKYTLTSLEMYEEFPIGRDAFMTWMRKDKEVEDLIINAQFEAQKNKLNPIEKQCKSCNEVKETFNFQKSQRYADGLIPYCKDCVNKNIEKVAPDSKKKCLKCKKAKSRKSFTRNMNFADGLVPFCKTCKSNSRRAKRSINSKLSDTANS